MTRVAIVAALLLVAMPLAGEGQGSNARLRVGFVGAESPSTNAHFLDAFRSGMRAQGYVEGQNVTIEARWSEVRIERFPEVIAELIRLDSRVIVTVSVGAALAAKKLTSTIPIVFIASDPLGTGLVPNLGRPGGNVTGFSLF